MDNEEIMQAIRQDLDIASLSCQGVEGRAAMKRVRDNIEYIYTQFLLDSTVGDGPEVYEDGIEDLL